MRNQESQKSKVNGGLDNITALQIIFQNTVAISAIFPEFVTVSSGKVLKMGSCHFLHRNPIMPSPE